MNSVRSAEMREPIHALAAKLAAMSKVMYNDAKGGYANRCCIWIENGSNLAMACDGKVGALVKIESFTKLAGEDYAESLELAAAHASLMPIQYANGYCLVTSKNYDAFISNMGQPISESGEWKNYECTNNVQKILPNLESCEPCVDNGKLFDPKLLIILQKVKESDEFNASYMDVQHRLVSVRDDETHVSGCCIAVYPNMVLLIMAMPENTEVHESPVSDLAFEYKFFKK